MLGSLEKGEQMDKNYYEILGLNDSDKNLSDKEFKEKLKKAYKTAAMKWHPDRWVSGTDEEKKTAEEKFKDISEAYEVLSNPQKRAQYDNGGDFNFEGDEDFDPNDLFARMMSQFNDMEDMFGKFRGGFHNQRQRKGSNIQSNITITLEEAYRGGEFDVEINREKTCHHCNGTGSSDGKSTKCPHCNGKGLISKMNQVGGGSFQMFLSQCPHCHGTGRIINTPCSHCHGTGIEYETTIKKISIPAGISDGMTIVIPNEGNAPEGGGINGDLYINVTVKGDSYYYRPDPLNVIHYDDVPFNECLLGFTKEYKCLDGSKVTVNAAELTPHGKSFIFKGKGFANPNDPRQIGDYVIVIRYKLPNKLTDKQKKALKEF